ncbi:MAG TPA: SH3 domain-containing protein [Aggregatilineales bacterium]|nr:SH3 domain-containing protein [Aggregatilineales bacterium]
MSELILIFFAGVLALLYGLNALLQAIRRAPKLGRVALYLAALVLGLVLTALIRLAGAEQAEPLAQPAVLIIAAGLGVFSLIALLGELFRPERLQGSRGVLGLGVALLMALSTVTIPVTRQTILAQLPPTPTLPVISLAQLQSGPTSTLTPTRTPFPTFTPSATRTPRAVTATATSTPIQFPTRTPVPTATLPTPCVANTQYNVNLRAEPDTESDLVITLPFGTAVMLYGRNTDSTWWFAEVDGQRGWLNGEFLVVSPACSTLPVR